MHERHVLSRADGRRSSGPDAASCSHPRVARRALDPEGGAGGIVRSGSHRPRKDGATATIIRGFLDVKITGLPDALQKQIDATIDVAEKAGF